jgi:monoamine oxidase
MPRYTPSSARLRRLRAAVREAERQGRPIEEVDDEREERFGQWLARSLDRSAEQQDARQRRVERILEHAEPTASGPSRRQLLGLTTAAGLGAALASPPAWATSDRASAPRIAVVGAGLAGLTAAYQIQRRSGWTARVYEASTRVGGRVWTLRGTAGGQFVERGGGGINTRDTNLIRLATHLGLTPLVDTWLNYPNSSSLYSFGGRTYAWAQLRPGITEIEQAARAVWRDIGYIPTHQRHNRAARRWDHRSVADLVDSTAYPRSTPAGSYIAHWFGGEYGVRAPAASALHYVMDAGDAYPGGGWDERYCIPGGNDVLPTTLASHLPAGSLHLDHRLAAVTRRRDGAYSLVFNTSGGGTKTVIADRVVLAIPPTVLRHVDLRQAGISPRHLVQIRRQPLGTGAKLNVQFAGRPWRAAGHSGDMVSDTTVQMAWSSQFQATNPATLVVLDNRDGDYDHTTPAHGLAPHGVRRRLLRRLDRWYPTASSLALADQFHLDYWPNDRHIGGTWSAYSVGGFTTYGGIEAQREGNLHFAGETTAPFVEHSTMCGAVTSGLRAAREVTSY